MCKPVTKKELRHEKEINLINSCTFNGAHLRSLLRLL